MMMKVWLATFGILFALAELYQWLKAFTLPLPIYVLGGAFLAIASNSDKGMFSAFSPTPLQSQHRTASVESPVVISDVHETLDSAEWEPLSQSVETTSTVDGFSNVTLRNSEEGTGTNL